jgi:hypothetical protein
VNEHRDERLAADAFDWATVRRVDVLPLDLHALVRERE